MELITGAQILRLLGALILVVCLMLGLNLVMRRIHNGATMISGQKRRLRIIEVIPLDHRRRAMLIRRDDRDHLVILGPTGETVVETGITAPAQEDTKNA